MILETTLIRLASPETNYIESAVMARIKKLEENKGKMTYAVMPDRVSTDKKNESKSDDANLSSEDDKKIKEIKLSPATFKDANALIENWKVIISSIGLTMRAVLSDSKIIPVGEKELKYVEVQISNEMYNILFENNKPIELEEKLTESIEKIINKKIEIRIVSEQDSKYSKDVLWKKEDAYDKIDMEIEEE